MAQAGCPIKAEPFWDENGKQFLRITPRWARVGMQCRNVFIPYDQFWIYSEQHNPIGFKSSIATLSMQLNRLYDFGLDERRLLAKIATEIQFGIQEAFLAKPPRRERERIQIGEVDITAVPRNAPGQPETVVKNVPLYADQLPASASSEEDVQEIVTAHDTDPRGRDL